MPNDHRTDIRAYARDTERTMQSALWRARGLCPACGEESDYCLGHGPIGDPAGAAILDQFPLEEDAWEWFAGWALDVEHTARLNNMGDPDDPEETRLLLTYGGPTVVVTYSHRYGTAELFHSWGRAPFTQGRQSSDGSWRYRLDPQELRQSSTLSVTADGFSTEADAEADAAELLADRTTWEMDPETVREFVETFAPHPLGEV